MNLAGSEDPKPQIEAECAESHHCHSLKSKLDTCSAKIEGGSGAEGETCVEEFFDLMECVNHCETASGKQVTTLMESKWNLFVGDLESSVVDSDLWDAFSHYESLVSARVLRDSESNKSKGYGFVSFSSEAEAEKVLEEMNKTRIKDREIRVNWAVQKVSQRSKSTFDKIFHSTSQYNSTVYVGNCPESIMEKLGEMFGEFGYVMDLKICKGFAFVKMDSHHSAALSILKLNGTVIDGSTLKVSWGKERYNWQPVLQTPMLIPYPYMYNNLVPFAYPNIIQPMVNMHDQNQNQGNQENQENIQ